MSTLANIGLGDASAPLRPAPSTSITDVPLVLDTAGVAKLLQCSENLVRELASNGTLPGRKLGKDWRFARDLVLAFLAGDKAGRALDGETT